MEPQELRALIRASCLIAASNVATFAIDPTPDAVEQLASRFERFAYGAPPATEGGGSLTFADEPRDPKLEAERRAKLAEEASALKAQRKADRKAERFGQIG